MQIAARTTFPPRRTTEKLLLGPGPSNADPRVLRAMSEPILGHLDPDFLDIMSETRELLQYVFDTKNELTLAMPGTGSAGMESAWANAVEPGMKVIVCDHGVFGNRMRDVASRYEAEVVPVTAPMGRPIDPGDLERALRDHPDAEVVGIVHAETSTGVLQPMDDIAKTVKSAGKLLLVDCVTSLGGMEVPVERLDFDMAYSGTQKCLSCPPGLAPLTVGPAMAERIRNRSTPVRNWYLDLNMITRYWAEERFYHHTAPISMTYALNESLRIIAEEGLHERWDRHLKNARALWRALEALGLKLLVEERYRLPSLTTFLVPNGVDDATVRKALLSRYGIEVGGGLGELKGKILRVGLMGYNSTVRNIVLLVAALAEVLAESGFKCDAGDALAALRSA